MAKILLISFILTIAVHNIASEKKKDHYNLEKLQTSSTILQHYIDKLDEGIKKESYVPNLPTFDEMLKNRSGLADFFVNYDKLNLNETDNVASYVEGNMDMLNDTSILRTLNQSFIENAKAASLGEGFKCNVLRGVKNHYYILIGKLMVSDMRFLRAAFTFYIEKNFKISDDLHVRYNLYRMTFSHTNRMGLYASTYNDIRNNWTHFSMCQYSSFKISEISQPFGVVQAAYNDDWLGIKKNAEEWGVLINDKMEEIAREILPRPET